MNRLHVVLLAGLVLRPAAAAAAGAPPPVQVIIHDHAFRPPVVHVKAGQRIVWTNTDQDPHTVTSGGANVDDGRWKSSPLIPDGATFTLRLTKPGVYPYFCKPHEFEASMHGKIIVAP
ncbi:MAG TPA: cupredoxin domain-containing protein [Candidatus Sulfotelmatobacter sp.]|nr:cupredoxin domain-containing protein [Candidatus Sulfotelmatobacter sp.]